MSSLLGQSYLFSSSIGKTKHEATRSGFGYWDLLKNQKDKSSYYLRVTPLPAVPSMMSPFPSPAGLSQSGKAGQNHVHSCFADAHSD